MLGCLCKSKRQDQCLNFNDKNGSSTDTLWGHCCTISTFQYWPKKLLRYGFLKMLGEKTQETILQCKGGALHQHFVLQKHT